MGLQLDIFGPRKVRQAIAVDPNSTAFRYGNYGTSIDAGDASIKFEAYVSLSHLQAAMLALNTALFSAVAEIRLGRQGHAL